MVPEEGTVTQELPQVSQGEIRGWGAVLPLSSPPTPVRPFSLISPIFGNYSTLQLLTCFLFFVLSLRLYVLSLEPVMEFEPRAFTLGYIPRPSYFLF